MFAKCNTEIKILHVPIYVSSCKTTGGLNEKMCVVFSWMCILLVVGDSSNRLSRYVTVTTQNNTETVIVRQLVAYLSANDASERSTPVNCLDCLSRIVGGDDKVCACTHVLRGLIQGRKANLDFLIWRLGTVMVWGLFFFGFNCINTSY